MSIAGATVFFGFESETPRTARLVTGFVQDPNFDYSGSFFAFANTKTKNEAGVEQIIDQGEDSCRYCGSVISPARLRAMASAIYAQDERKIDLLLRAGVRAGGDIEGTLFIELAASLPSESVFAQLVAAGASLAHEDVLLGAVSGDSRGGAVSSIIVAEILRAAPPESDVLHTALRIAAVSGNPEVVCMLLAQGADPNGRCADFDDTPLQNAEREGHTEVIELLIRAGATAR